MKKHAFFTVALLSILLSSCMYQFVGKYSSLPGGIKSVYVENIENMTFEPNLQVYLKRDLIGELELDPRVRVTDKKRAGGIVRVKIIRYNISPSAFDKSGFASIYRCYIEAVVSLYEKNKSVINNKKLSTYMDYSAKDEISATEIARRTVIKVVLKDLSSKIKDELFIEF